MDLLDPTTVDDHVFQADYQIVAAAAQAASQDVPDIVAAFQTWSVQRKKSHMDKFPSNDKL